MGAAVLPSPGHPHPRVGLGERGNAAPEQVVARPACRGVGAHGRARLALTGGGGVSEVVWPPAKEFL